MKYLGVFVVGLIAGYLIFHSENSENQNSKMIYGNTGLPKNCRAIVAENYKGWLKKEFTAEGSLDSINRNCGEFGYAWDSK